MRSKAVRKGNWIPVGLFADLDPVAQKHREAVRNLATELDSAAALGRSFEEEDAKRVEAYKTGLEVPEMTPPDERQRLVLDARARVEGAQLALQEAAIAAVRFVQQKEPDFFDELRALDATAQEKREQAARLLAEAEAERARYELAAHWVKRTARNADASHISLDDIPKAPAQPVPPIGAGLHGAAVAVGG